MPFEVIFRGGPLGGERRVVEKLERQLRVPSMRPLRPMSIDHTYDPKDTPVMYDAEIYYLHGRPSWGGPEYEYRWENPNQSLLNKITKLEKEIRDLTEDRELIEALRVLRKKL